jgi:ABC-2 type transport system ATP-binding protein
MSVMIEIKGLTKRFGPITAVSELSMKVERGEVLGFLGPNGAGKSTTMKMVTGFLSPTAGTASVCGHDVVSDPLGVKMRIGYLPEGAPAYPDMTPEGFLGFVADVRGLRGPERRRKLDAAVERLQLQGVMRQPIDTLSKGYKRRVGLAQAVLHEPDVLILDEPTDGLDPNQKHQVRTLIKDMAKSGGKCIVLSTHILEEVEAVCTRAVVIARGRLVADGTPAQLQARSKYHNAVSLNVRQSDGKAVLEELARLSVVASVEDAGSTGGSLVRCVVIPKGGRSIASEIAAHVKQRGWQVDGLRVESGRLDDVFREITR